MLRRGSWHCCVFALSILLTSTANVNGQERVEIDAQAQATPFPHFWERMFGSGRAILTLRESYREDVRAVKQVADFRYVRFHAIFHDEVGVYNEDEHGNPVYNFSYVDQIYDGLLKNGVRPFVEISFMPKKLAFNPDALHPFWYKQNVSPPKSMERWDDLIKHFAQHLVDRYGISEVSQWYFEVWNEPNIDFWGGIPRQRSYFDLYAHTARDLKSVSPQLRVGGPRMRITSRWILFRRTDTPTIRCWIYSGRKKRFRWMSAYAERSEKWSTRSKLLLLPTFLCFGRSGMYRARRNRETQPLWGRGLRIRCASATDWST